MTDARKALDLLGQRRLVAIARGVPAQALPPLALALKAAGVALLELTLDPLAKDPGADLRERLGALEAFAGADFLLGAGTVLSPEDVRAAHEAGARFIVSPHADEEIIRETKALGMLSVPGGRTPTEILRAWRAGADVVKVFPLLPEEADSLRVLRGPLPHIPLLPTGGITLSSIQGFLDAGAYAVAAGEALLPATLVRAGDWASIRALAERFVRIAGRA